jgi:hypothetical protein
LPRNKDIEVSGKKQAISRNKLRKEPFTTGAKIIKIVNDEIESSDFL